jgi:hypothetical protein
MKQMLKVNMLFLMLLLAVMAACTDKKTEKPKEEPKAAPKEDMQSNLPPKDQKAPECFTYLNNKDTVYLQISEAYNMITGLLLYKYYKKDQNLGTIQGKMIGDILLADYSFKSEGKSSVRQVAFKRKGSDFIEGYGDVMTVSGKTVFKNVNTLKFNDAAVLRSIPCSQ